MKTKIIYALMGVVSMLTVARVDAATVFAPTDGDVNFLFGDLTGAQLAIFDDTDQSYAGSSLGVLIGDIVGFAGPNGSGDFTATNTTSALALTLIGSDNFILGLSTDGGTNWLPDTSITALGANAYRVAFSTGNNVTEVDVRVVMTNPVPVPPAVWLFGSGLLGLVGIARRKKVV